MWRGHLKTQLGSDQTSADLNKCYCIQDFRASVEDRQMEWMSVYVAYEVTNSKVSQSDICELQRTREL